MRLTNREKAILKLALIKAEAARQLSIHRVELSLGVVVKTIWPTDAPKTADQTAAWTMRNLSNKMEHLGSGFTNSGGMGRAKRASYVFDQKAIETARQMKIDGLLN